MLLTAADLRDLTGYRRASAQRRWLDKHGMRYAVRRDGVPVLTWQQVDIGLSGHRTSVAEPDFAAMLRYGPSTHA